MYSRDLFIDARQDYTTRVKAALGLASWVDWCAIITGRIAEKTNLPNIKEKLRKLVPALVIGIAGAVLGMMMGIMQMSQLERVDQHVDILPFQNFALYSGLLTGLLFGIVAFVVFMALSPRFQYPASSSLGAWLGVTCGILICFITNLLINSRAASYQFVPSNGPVFAVSSVITSFLGGTAGLVTGYFLALVGARNLHSR